MSLWSLDTCACVFEMDADFNCTAIVNLCEHHATHEAAYADCRAKNAVIAEAAKALGVDAGMVPWSFDAGRVCHATSLDGKATLASSAALSAEAFSAAPAVAEAVSLN